MTLLRKCLDWLYTAGGVVGALFIVFIAIIIVVQVVGREMGFQIPGADDFTAYSVAASLFFAMAYTFRKGAHIQVTLLIEHLKGKTARAAALVSLSITTVVIGFLTLSAANLVYDSYRFDDVAQGLLRTPMWIPHTTLLMGAALLFVAILDTLLTQLFTGSSPIDDQSPRNDTPAE
ncbi:MAG: TRAP transporter small permease [Alphaproteobacteria bacterium]|nr:TRAP transporter small permease [Alphaproteobacteria bacterium]